ncbi:MAG: glycosyltransferase [Vulcanimicrobiaceae bacterium]
MDYSIIIPLFNKAALTKQCLDALLPTIADAGQGEVIVVDNASSDSTAELLASYPWLTVLRNDINVGFARANNQAAEIARGEFLVLLNNDTVPHVGWLKAMLTTARQMRAGIVGARLLFPDGTIQHAGVVMSPVRLSRIDTVPVHFAYRYGASDPMVNQRRAMQAVTAACLLTPREVYRRVGGLDPQFWNGYEDVDFCLKVQSLGLDVIYEPAAVVTHFESQSGAHRFRQVNWNTELLARHWNGRVHPDDVATYLQAGRLRVPRRTPRGGYNLLDSTIPGVTLLLLNADEAKAKEIRESLRDAKSPIHDVLVLPNEEWFELVSAALERRGARYVCFLDAGARLEPGWLDALVATVEWSETIGASAACPSLPCREDVVATAVGARCTLIAMDRYPQHHRPLPFPTIDGTVADFLHRGAAFSLTTRGVSKPIGTIPKADSDQEILRQYAVDLSDNTERSEEQIEAVFAASIPKEPRPNLVSIVTLSWNALEFTQLAIESIRAHTSTPYEIIVVDNGSDEATVAWLREQPELRVIYNTENRGFAGGNNQGMAIARGEFVIVLNNDVLVTDGWVEGLLAPFGRIPALGMTAPRSNKVAGSQQLEIANYTSADEYQSFAQRTRHESAGIGWLTDRAIGFCLCIDRRVISEVGGFDEHYGVGNFEDDDFSLRVRSAGYKILVCDDVVIHHFGSKTFAANKIDYADTMQRNWSIFAKKWGFQKAFPQNGYSSTEAIARGFDRAKHFAPLTAPSPSRLRFVACVTSEADWETLAAFVKRFSRAYRANDPVTLDIAAFGDADPEAIAGRIERLLHRNAIDSTHTALIEIGYETSFDSWLGDTGRTFRVTDADNARYRAVPSHEKLSVKALQALLTTVHS